MPNENEVVDATVVQKTPVQVLTEQQENFRKQLEQAKNNMVKLQQQFEAQKTLAVKLEGALEAGDLLFKTFSK